MINLKRIAMAGLALAVVAVMGTEARAQLATRKTSFIRSQSYQGGLYLKSASCGIATRPPCPVNAKESDSMVAVTNMLQPFPTVPAGQKFIITDIRIQNDWAVRCASLSALGPNNEDIPFTGCIKLYTDDQYTNQFITGIEIPAGSILMLNARGCRDWIDGVDTGLVADLAPTCQVSFWVNGYYAK